MKTINQIITALQDHNRALKGEWNYNCSMVTLSVHSGSGVRMTTGMVSTTDEDVIMDTIALEIEEAAHNEAEERLSLGGKKARLLAELERINGEIG